MRKTTNDKRIRPANLRNLPTVLDTEQACNVLRISVERVRKLTNEGALHRLTYAREFLCSAEEFERFLRESTAAAPPRQIGDATCA